MSSFLLLFWDHPYCDLPHTFGFVYCIYGSNSQISLPDAIRFVWKTSCTLRKVDRGWQIYFGMNIDFVQHHTCSREMYQYFSIISLMYRLGFSRMSHSSSLVYAQSSLVQTRPVCYLRKCTEAGSTFSVFTDLYKLVNGLKNVEKYWFYLFQSMLEINEIWYIIPIYNILSAQINILLSPGRA